MHSPAERSDHGDASAPHTRRVATSVALVLLVLLVAALVWSLMHVRYTRAPQETTPATRPFAYPPGRFATKDGPPPPARTAPHHLYIPALGVRAAIVPVSPIRTTIAGVATIELPVPDLPDVGVSASGGRLSGGAGTVLVVGHISYNGVPGPMWNLASIAAGTDIYTTDGHGRLEHWRVYSNQVVAKNSPSWPVDVFTNAGSRRLALVTCAGKVQRVSGDGYVFTENQFVYAAPVRSATSP